MRRVGKVAGAVCLFPLSLLGLLVSYWRGRWPDHPSWAAWDRFWTWVGWLVVVVAGLLIVALAVSIAN
ncbi:MAG: hypothetical protein F4217_08075 [Acidimicrobiaceae bacterium]|nr:hypothetical protein [Acidimicrobiaceae bacterium]